jgi:mono/diheme cytochrome c family protein
MDRSQVFLDSLVLPRAIGLVKGGALVSENIPLWYAEDRDGDFRADSRTLIDSAYGGTGMPEHSANGLWMGLDNWIYNAKSKYRYRKIDGEWVKDETEFRGQWGISHDNAGRLFYNYNWSQLHTDLVPPNSLQDNEHHTPGSGIDHGLTLDRTIYPIRSNTAVNRGYIPGTLDEERRLLEFTAACSPLVYRGDALPSSYSGDVFVCEPTANLIKQNNLNEQGFILSASAVYRDREFLASSDERFRPVSLASGPDGALYVADMYKGIIQHLPYMTDYLREVILKRKLDKPINMGRIWRITSKSKQEKGRPDLEKLGLKELVSRLESPNGWTRDNAQRLLVEKGDLSVLDDLKLMIATGKPLGQLHALWALEGLGVTDPTAYLQGLASQDPVVAQSALRILAPMSSAKPEVREALEQFIASEYEEAPPLLQMQMILESDKIAPGIALEKTKKFLETYGELPVARDVAMSSLEGREMDLLMELLPASGSTIPDQNREIFLEILATAITNSGELTDITKLLAMLEPGREHPGSWIRTAILHGMLNAAESRNSTGFELAVKPKVFGAPNMAGEPLLAQLENSFSWPGKPEVQRTEKTETYDIDAGIMAKGRKQYLNLCASCHGTQGEGMNRFAPPLQQSEWVNGEDYKLAMILLHGMEGPVKVNGKEYNIPDILPSMPSFSTLQDQDIAAIATYIRNSWGHSNPAISGRLVGGIRFRTQGKIQPWKASELDTLQFNLQ